MRWLPLLAAILVGLALHGVLLLGLDLHDLPGPGGALLARDLLLGQHQQGPASWLLAPLGWLFLVPGLRIGGLASLAMATTGAGLAAWGLAGRRAAPWATLLAGCWALVVHQALLVDPGTLSWGLAWLGLGLAWWGGAQRRVALVGAGAGLVALGVATKASALPVLALVLAAPWLRDVDRSVETAGRGWLRCALGLILGLSVGALLGWLMMDAQQPWMGAQAVESGGHGWLLAVLALPGRGLVHGRFPWLAGLALLGTAVAFRKQPMAAAVLVLSLLAWAVVGEARAERLQPRHLLPASVGLVALAGCVAAWRRPGWAAPTLLAVISALAALDGLAFAHGFSAQRERFAQTRPARLPALPGFAMAPYAELPWPVFYESSLAGVSELLELPDGAPVASPVFQERREVHLELAALQAGWFYRRLSQPRCCLRDQDIDVCAREVVEGLDAAGALLVLPGKLEVVADGDRAFARALQQALGRPPRRAVRWRAVRGTGSGGELPCREGK